MSAWSEEINRITSSDIPLSFYIWVEILNFFERHKDELEIEELQKLVDKCEQCRVYLNTVTNDPIKKEDTNPNIYKYLEQRIIEDKKNNEEWNQDYQEVHLANA